MTACYVRHHLSLNRRLQPAVRQGQFLHSSQTSAGHRRRKIGRYSFAIVGSSQAFHGYQKRPAYEPHGICDRFPSSTPARHSPHPAGLSARRLPTLRAWPALASWMLCPQSRSAVALGPIAASDTDTAILPRRLRPTLLPVARPPRPPAPVHLAHSPPPLARHSPHPAGLSARRLPTLRAWPALASWMLCPQSRSAVAIGPIAASDTDTALLLRRLRPYLLPVARLPRAPALVRLGHAAACLVGGVAGAVAAPLRRLDRLGAPDSAALAGLAGGAA